VQLEDGSQKIATFTNQQATESQNNVSEALSLYPPTVWAASIPHLGFLSLSHLHFLLYSVSENQLQDEDTQVYGIDLARGEPFRHWTVVPGKNQRYGRSISLAEQQFRLSVVHVAHDIRAVHSMTRRPCFANERFRVHVTSCCLANLVLKSPAPPMALS
jgi:hypothetical protein